MCCHAVITIFEMDEIHIVVSALNGRSHFAICFKFSIQVFYNYSSQFKTAYCVLWKHLVYRR